MSEGQYDIVLDQELPLLRKACQELYPADDTTKGLPRLSIIVVGKRHNTRFSQPGKKTQPLLEPAERHRRRPRRHRSSQLGLLPAGPSCDPRDCRSGPLLHRPGRDLPRPQGAGPLPERRRRSGGPDAQHVLSVRPRHQSRQHLPPSLLCRPGV